MHPTCEKQETSIHVKKVKPGALIVSDRLHRGFHTHREFPAWTVFLVLESFTMNSKEIDVDVVQGLSLSTCDDYTFVTLKVMFDQHVDVLTFLNNEKILQL